MVVTSEALGYKRILVEIVVFERGVGHFERKFQGESRHSPKTLGVRKLQLLGYISRGVVCVILSLAVLIQYRRVTDRQTDRQTDTR